MNTPRQLFAIFAAFAVLATEASAETISGRARVTDGDTIVVRGTSIRLEGIDAPETDQICISASGRNFPCGLRARAALMRLIAGRAVDCEIIGIDRYRRRLAFCAAGGDDINSGMVTSGWALAFRRYSMMYVRDEEGARDRSDGLWAGSFIAPWEWRSRTTATTVLGALAVPRDAPQRLTSPGVTDAVPVAGCTIKGNISRRGERIYHLTAMRDYQRTRIDRWRGERWFCTELEATAAGWRKARR